jgi:hypothetical protein
VSARGRGAGAWWLALILYLGVLFSAASTPAQDPPPAGTEPVGEAAEVESDDAFIEEILAGDTQVEGGSYIYDVAGRRDPFVNPLGRGEEEGDGTERPRPPGFPGMLINEVALWGITVFGEDPIAIFRGTDGVGYFVQEGDELWDGKVVAIDFDRREVSFQQRVDDPTSPVRFREVESRLTD